MNKLQEEKGMSLDEAYDWMSTKFRVEEHENRNISQIQG